MQRTVSFLTGELAPFFPFINETEVFFYLSWRCSALRQDFFFFLRAPAPPLIFFLRQLMAPFRIRVKLPISCCVEISSKVASYCRPEHRQFRCWGPPYWDKVSYIPPQERALRNSFPLRFCGRFFLFYESGALRGVPYGEKCMFFLTPSPPLRLTSLFCYLLQKLLWRRHRPSPRTPQEQLLPSGTDWFSPFSPCSQG